MFFFCYVFLYFYNFLALIIVLFLALVFFISSHLFHLVAKAAFLIWVFLKNKQT